MTRTLNGLLAASALGASLLLAGGAFAQTLRIIPQADLKLLDPVQTTAQITQIHAWMVYDKLFELNENLEPKPQMVDSWKTSDDSMTWAFALREGLKFHDGQPVTAKDAVASIKRWAVKKAIGTAMMERAASLEATGPLTFELKLKEAFGPVLRALADTSGPFIMRESDAMLDADSAVQEAIGSGPFIFATDEWVPGSKVVYRKNPDYVPRDEPTDGFAGSKEVFIDRVEWNYIPDTNTATQALLSGEMDVYDIPPTELLPLMEADPNIVVKSLYKLGKMGHIRPNHLHPPFDNVKARQALQLLVEQKQFLAAMIGNPKYEQVCYAVFMCNSPYETDKYSEAWQNPDFDKAKQLMAEAGYNGEPIVVMAPTDQQIIYNNVLVMAAALREIGVNVDLQSMDWSSLTARRLLQDDPNKEPNKGWHIFPTWWTGDPMASPLTNTPLVARGTDKATWFGWPEDKEIEDGRAEFIAATTEEERKAAIDKLQKRFYEFFPYINTGQFLTPVAWRSNIKDVPNALLFMPWGLKMEG